MYFHKIFNGTLLGLMAWASLICSSTIMVMHVMLDQWWGGAIVKILFGLALLLMFFHTRRYEESFHKAASCLPEGGAYKDAEVVETFRAATGSQIIIVFLIIADIVVLFFSPERVWHVWANWAVDGVLLVLFVVFSVKNMRSVLTLTR